MKYKCKKEEHFYTKLGLLGVSTSKMGHSHKGLVGIPVQCLINAII